MKINNVISLLLFLWYFVLISCNGSNSNKQNNSIDSVKFMEHNEATDYDFSEIIMSHETDYLGYIGEDFERLCIIYNKIEKINSTEYLIEGKSKVKENICNFSGSITIKEIKELDELDSEDQLSGEVSREGYFMAECIFNEDPSQKGTGVFRGTLVCNWYMDNKQEIHYDDLTYYSDGYCNNQFEGSWTSYKTKKQKPCAWGHYRIPNSGDLDIGAGEFVVNPKYIQKGWQNNCDF